MFQIGRLCIKIAGRDAGKKCVIVDVLDDTFVLIDGETRRRKCNTIHLEPLSETIKIDKNASHDKVKTEFKKLGIELKDTKKKESKAKPKKTRKSVQKKAIKSESAKDTKKTSKPKAEKSVKDNAKAPKAEPNKDKPKT
jgi:large subunit ribosomal protein L14e